MFSLLNWHLKINNTRTVLAVEVEDEDVVQLVLAAVQRVGGALVHLNLNIDVALLSRHDQASAGLRHEPGL